MVEHRIQPAQLWSSFEQKRREKRVAARQSEKDTGKEANEKVQDQPTKENVKTTNTAEQPDSMLGDKNMIVPEVCKDEDYEVAPLSRKIWVRWLRIF